MKKTSIVGLVFSIIALVFIIISFCVSDQNNILFAISLICIGINLLMTALSLFENKKK